MGRNFANVISLPENVISLPENVISSKDIITFEKGLDEFWKDQPLLYDDHKAEIKFNLLPY